MEQMDQADQVNVDPVEFTEPQQEAPLSEVEPAFQSAPAAQIPDKIYFRIGDVAEIVGVKPYVLRYWESEFPIIAPEKSNTGQRVYKRGDVETLLLIKHLLYTERYSIEGARKRIRQLRKSGELHSYKREAVLGSEDGQQKKDAGQKKKRLKEILKLASQIHQASGTPIQELFRL